MRLNQDVCKRACITFFLLVLASLSACMADDPNQKKRLLLAADRYAKELNQGSIHVKYEGGFGNCELYGHWIGERSRRKFDYSMNEALTGREWTSVVRSRESQCTVLEHALNATCSLMRDTEDLMVATRLLPFEFWFHVVGVKPLRQWVDEQNVFVVERSDGSFSSFVGDSRLVQTCVSAIRSGDSFASVPLDGWVMHVRHSPQGLWIDNEFLGNSPPESQFRDVRKWTTGDRPRLISAELDYSRDVGQTWKTEFRVQVIDYQHSLPENAPSMSIPPSDLIFGTAVVDRRPGRTKLQYVGGEAGRAHHGMQMAIRRLKSE